MSTVRVRYIVNDVDEAIGFYRDLLGFEVVMHPAAAVRDALPGRSPAAAERSEWTGRRWPVDAGRHPATARGLEPDLPGGA
jgi:catechol 2,3-dioxygenase-like lactoylglutathione lyase family enzyme